MHIKRAHEGFNPAAIGAERRENGAAHTCPDCGKVYASGSGYRSHRAKHHPPSTALVAVGPTRGRPSKAATFRPLSGFTLLSDDHGGIWIAEKVR